MKFLQHPDLGKLLLRLVIGCAMLMHGIDKISHGIGGLQGLFASKGLPGFLANAVYLGEVFAPLLIIAGFYSRLGGLLVGFTMLVAVSMAHLGDVMTLTENGGWGIELQALYFFGALAIAFLGSGKYAISGGSGSWD